VLGDQLEDVHAPSSTRINGVTVAVVIDNLDAEGQGRVQVSFPWMPDVEPWARVCAPVAGSGAGIWALPQIGDEVLVAFANGDIMHPYVLGGLWSMTSRPPAPLPTDAQTKRVIKTPTGHAITLDDVPPAITIEHVAGHKIEMTATGIKISTTGGAASIELTTAGAIKINATATVDVGGPAVTIAGDVSAKMTGGASAEVSAIGPCKIAGALVAIN
jgi:phage baseplate assembly protein V